MLGFWTCIRLWQLLYPTLVFITVLGLPQTVAVWSGLGPGRDLTRAARSFDREFLPTEHSLAALAFRGGSKYSPSSGGPTCHTCCFNTLVLLVCLLSGSNPASLILVSRLGLYLLHFEYIFLITHAFCLIFSTHRTSLIGSLSGLYTVETIVLWLLLLGICFQLICI